MPKVLAPLLSFSMKWAKIVNVKVDKQIIFQKFQGSCQMAKKKRKGKPGCPTPSTRVVKALELVKQRNKKKKRKNKKSTRKIAEEVGVWSKSTINRWTQQDMSEEGVKKRIMNRGWRKALTEEELKIVSGWVVYRWMKHKHSSIKKIQKFVASAFGVDFSNSWVSKNMKAQHIASHRTQESMLNLERPTMKKEMVDWLINLHHFIQKHHIQPQQILTWDVKSFHSHTVINQSYGPIGG